MDFDVIYAGTPEELYEQAKTKVAEGWNLQGDAGMTSPIVEGGGAPGFVYFYQVITKTGEVDFEAARERLLKMAEKYGI